jgi:hypothetical protein
VAPSFNDDPTGFKVAVMLRCSRQHSSRIRTFVSGGAPVGGLGGFKRRFGEQHGEQTEIGVAAQQRVGEARY